MTRLLLQYLAIWNDKNLPNSIKNLPPNILPNTESTIKNCQRLLKDFQSGEFLPNLVSLITNHDCEHALA